MIQKLIRLRTIIQQTYFIVGFSFIAVLLAGVIVGPDANWDLRNYHYSNGRSIVTLSLFEDVAPAGIQTFFNPIIDIPVYLSVHFIDDRWGLILWTAIVQWFCAFSIWRFTGVFSSLRRSSILRVLALALALAGSGAASLAFTTFGDWIVAALICESMIRIMIWHNTARVNERSLWFAGIFLGLAAAIKLTSATYALAVIVALLVTAGSQSALKIVRGASVGILVMGAPWMLLMFFRFRNPVFPYYNTIFGSASAPDSSSDDRRYGAGSIKDVVRFPFDMLRGGSRYTEIAIQDWRYCGLLLLVALVVAVSSTVKVEEMFRDSLIRFWTIFLIVSFGSWIIVFGIYRYFLFGEIATSILIAAVVAHLCQDRIKVKLALASMITVGLAFQTLPAWGRGQLFDNDQLDSIVSQRTLAPQHVIFAGPPPFGYITESFPTTARFASLYPYQSNELVLAGPLRRELDEFLARGLQSGSLYLVADAGSSMPLPVLSGFAATNCAPFIAFDRQLELCDLRRTTG